jgi:hypothetical protein
MGVNGRPTRACALSTEIEMPPCSDQLKDSSAAHAKTDAAIATVFKFIFMAVSPIRLLRTWLVSDNASARHSPCAPASRTASGRSQTNTVHQVHTGSTGVADLDDELVRLLSWCR